MSSLDSRYGRSSDRSGRVPGWVPVAVVLAVLGLTWLTWVAWSASREPVSARLTGYEVVSSRQVDVRLEVFRRGGEAVRCEVYAQAEDHSIVGSREVRLPAGRTGTTVVTTTVTTERPPVNGVLRGCELSGAR